MKKSTKGAVAAGAAAALLLGGAGSLAYWNATGSITGGTITAGKLTLTAEDTGTWTLNGEAVSNISSVRVVPGDELEFTGSYEIGAVGDNLEADLAVTGGAASGTLASYATVVPTFTLDGTTVTGTTEVTEDNDGDVVDAVITIDFPFGTTANNNSQQTTLNLADIGVTLTQTEVD